MRAWSLGVMLFLAVSLGVYIGVVRGLLFGTILPEETSMGGLIPSDALYYVSLASQYTLKELYEMGRNNALGPVALIKLMGLNLDLLFFGQVVVLALALRELRRHASVCPAKYAFFLLANPLVLLNLVSPNKEITAILAIIFIIVYINSGRFIHLLAGVGIAIFSKSEILALLLFYLSIRKFWPEKRLLLWMVLLGLVSFNYEMLSELGGRALALLELQKETSPGITLMLHELASKYFLFVVVILPRLVMTMLEGNINLLRGDPGELIIFVPIAWSGIMFVIIGLSVVRKTRLRLLDDGVFLLSLVMLMVAIVPFTHHRYLLPAYPLLVYLMLKPQRSKDARTRSPASQLNELSRISV